VVGVASIPYGSFNGIVTIALPYILRRHGVAVDHIATTVAFVEVPAIWYFLWAPVVDVGLRRRSWIVLLSIASALCAGLAIDLGSATTLRSLTALLIAGSVFSQPVSSALGGLVSAVIPNELRGHAGGWSQAGMVGGGVLAGGATVWLTSHASAAVTAWVAAALIALPSFAALRVREPAPPKRRLRPHLAAMARDVRQAFKRKDVRVGLLFFLSPIGAGALMNLFSAVASEFHASSADVIWVVAIAGIVTPAGALVGGIICDRFDRWRVYPIAGLTSAAAVTTMLFAPLTPTMYITGAAAYALTAGFCYAAFMSLAFELVGAESAASGTRFTVFMAAVNAPVAYMLRLDGWGHAHGGVRGMLAVDAMSNAVFGLALLVSVGRLRSRHKPLAPPGSVRIAGTLARHR
jgi:MFS family permease